MSASSTGEYSNVRDGTWFGLEGCRVSKFAGQWKTRRHSESDLAAFEELIVTIALDDDPSALDGAYTRPGADARMWGPLDHTGTVWMAEVDESGSTGMRAMARFVLSEDAMTIHGVWNGPSPGGSFLPWYGVRL